MRRHRIPNLRDVARPTAAESNEPEIFIYDYIDLYGVAASDVIGLLNIITADRVHVRINSYGGDCFEGVAIMNALRRHKAEIIVHVDGVAASAASIVALGGDQILMAKNAFLMVHHPWSFAAGNKHALRKIADDLEKIGDSAVRQGLIDKTDEDEEEVEKWLDAETWFDADAAVEAGLADGIESESDEEVEEVSDRIEKLFASIPEGLKARASKPANPKRQLERVLRDAGLGRVAARAFVSGGFAALASERDALDPAVKDGIQNLINNFTVSAR